MSKGGGKGENLFRRPIVRGGESAKGDQKKKQEVK